MAGNKGNTKAKGKEDKVKTTKGVTQVNEDSEDAIDFAVLRKPIPTSITGFAQARKIFDLATEELKDLLSNECDLLYECKVCRNIFRSLANFLSHKRVYCKEKFSSTHHGHFVSSTCTAEEMTRINRMESEYQQSLKPKTDNKDLAENDDRVQLSKDLTAVYEQIMKSKGVYANKDDTQVVLKKIPSSNVAVFQNIDLDEKEDDNIRNEVQEIDTLLSRDLAILGDDGKFIIQSSTKPINLSELDSVIQISDDDETEHEGLLKCKICDLQFSTRKTLRFHMKYKHLENRLVYPCPDCLEIFSTSWSVYRHLFKVHRKTAAQIRRLRESIQAKAFRMNNPPAFYEKRKNVKPTEIKKITEEERLDQENQAWMDNLETDGEVPRCGGCGRSFPRRAALAAHTHTCQPRSRALALARRTDKKIEIQIRKDYNKPPFGLTILKPAEMTENKTVNEEAPTTVKEVIEKEAETKPEEEKPPDVPEEEIKDEDDPPMDVDDDEKSNSSESPENVPVKHLDPIKPLIKLPFSLQAEKSNLAALKQRIFDDIDVSKFLCKKCNSTHRNVYDLYEHMAGHVNWLRYACKLCNFKHYSFEKLPEHVKVVHKLKGDSDFYYSTVKAIDGTEAMIISKCAETETADEAPEPSEPSPESRRPSRCSSDSSRLSDDSSSSSTLKEVGKRKRRMHHNKNTKKKKEANDDGEDQKDGDSMVDKAMKSIILGDANSNDKGFDENSSDMDDVDDKLFKRHSIDVPPTLTSRRPVRKRTRVHNEDFEYDLSNLLKKEAQGYRDSQTVVTTKVPQPSTTPKSSQASTTPKASQASSTTPKASQSYPGIKPYPAKKKSQAESSSVETINQDCIGALLILSKKAAEIGAAQMRTSNFAVYSTRPNIFAKPMLPRIIARGDKSSPKKDGTDDASNVIPVKITSELSITDKPLVKDEETTPSENNVNKITIKDNNGSLLINNHSVKLIKDNSKPTNDYKTPEDSKETNLNPASRATNIATQPIEQNGSEETEKSSSNMPTVVPIKFSSKSLELIKNPIINQNISEFSKAGMKTKILVIKPIHRNKDKSRPMNAPLKFQTIKLKDPSKASSSGKDRETDQVMVVQVPKVPRAVINETVVPVAKPSTESNEVKSCEENETTKTIAEHRELEEVKLDDEQLSILSNVEKQSESKAETDEGKTECVEEISIQNSTSSTHETPENETNVAEAST